MDRVEQKRKARHVRSKAARHDRFISAYIKKKNKDVYENAKKFYDDLDQKYPSKRDLTKTDEFVHETTGYTSSYQWYQVKYEAKKREPNSQETKDMLLEIPLMDKCDVDITVIGQKADESLSIPDNIYNDLVAEISKDPVMSSIFNGICQEQPQEIDEQQQELDQSFDELNDILLQEKSPPEDELENIVYE